MIHLSIFFPRGQDTQSIILVRGVTVTQGPGSPKRLGAGSPGTSHTELRPPPRLTPTQGGPGVWRMNRTPWGLQTSQAQAAGRDWGSRPGRREARPSQRPKPHPTHTALQRQSRAFSCLCLDCAAQWQEKYCPQARSSGSRKPSLVTWSKSLTLFSLSFFLCQIETTPTSQGCCMD